MQKSNYQLIIDRIQLFIQEKNLTNKDFELSVDMTVGLIAKTIKNKGSISSEKLWNIFQHYPELNRDWIFTGEGEMLKTNEVNEAQGQYLSLRDSKLPVPLVQQFVFPMLGDASAGYIVDFSRDAQIVYLESFDLPMQKSQNIRGFVVNGDSMYPLLNHHDIVFCQRVMDPQLHRYLQRDIYVVVCDEGIVVKHLSKKEDIFTLIPANKEYREMTLKTSEVLEVWRAEGRFIRYL